MSHGKKLLDEDDIWNDVDPSPTLEWSVSTARGYGGPHANELLRNSYDYNPKVHPDVEEIEPEQELNDKFEPEQELKDKFVEVLQICKFEDQEGGDHFKGFNLVHVKTFNGRFVVNFK